MDKTYIAKRTVSFVVGIGTTKIVHSVIQNNVNPETVTDTVTIFAASYVAGAMAADISRIYTDAKIDAICYWWRVNIQRTPSYT